MSKVRVAHITSIATSLRYLLSDQLVTLKNAGYDVTGISSSVPEEDVDFIKNKQIDYLPLTIARQIAPLQDLSSLWHLYHTIKQQNFTIVHTHNPKPGLLGQLAARAANVPIIVNTIHGFYFHEHMPPIQRHFYITLEKIAASCSDLILSQNHEDIETALAEGITTDNKIHYLGNGINLNIFDPDKISPISVDELRKNLNIKTTDKVIGFVGRLATQRKGFANFLRVCERLYANNKNLVFLIIGASDLGKSDSVDPASFEGLIFYPAIRYLGIVPNQELPPYYDLMDAIVLPSLFEGVPRVLMEATAMKVPSVASNVRGNRDVVQDGKNGYLTPLGDDDALYDALLDIINHPDKAKTMGNIGRELAIKQFDEQDVFQRILDHYARLLAEKNL